MSYRQFFLKKQLNRLNIQVCFSWSENDYERRICFRGKNLRIGTKGLTVKSQKQKCSEPPCQEQLWGTARIKVKVAQSCPTLVTPPGILQARILKWVAFPFSRGFSPPRDQTQVSHIEGKLFTSWVTRQAKNTAVGSLSFSRGSSRSRDQTRVSCITGRGFTSEPPVA